jgi:Asp-tRNA(Asn)/Glu-tRNA(Gln) amidotransferase B subunit
MNWLSELGQRYKDKIRIEIINVSSFRGVYKSIRHWTQTYPTFVVNKKEKYSGRDKSQLDLILQGHLGGS